MVSRFKFLDDLETPTGRKTLAMLQEDLIVVAEDAAVAAQRFLRLTRSELSDGAPDRRQGSRYRGGAEAAR
jgi:hypothetical protein